MIVDDGFPFGTRGMPLFLYRWLLEHGVRGFDQHGTAIYYLDERSLAVIRREYGVDLYEEMADFLGVYLAVSEDGDVIAVGPACESHGYH